MPFSLFINRLCKIYLGGARMRFLELFAGVGGFRKAALNAGWEPVGWAEIDKYARQSYLAIWPEAAQEVVIHDVANMSDDDLKNIKIDVLMAGFPCQSFSIAGKRGGFEDTRGTLFFEVARYAKAMTPKWIIAENVRGLLNHDNGRTFRVILDTLNEIGYDVDFHVYNATEFNVPQNRERVFILAKRRDVAIINMPIESTREPFEQRLLFDLAGNLFDDGVSFFPFPWPKGEGLHRTLADVLEPEVDEKYFLSEQMETKIRKAIREDVSEDLAEPCCTFQTGVVRNGRGEDTVYSEREIALTIDANYYKGLDAHQARTGVAVRAVLTPDREEKRQNGRRIEEDGEPMFTITAQDRHGVMIAQRGRGFNEGGLHEIAPAVSSHSYQDNNHVVIPKSGLMHSRGFETRNDGLSHCVKGAEGGSSKNFVDTQTRIRRLTPLETWRLQGREDWEHEAAKAAGVSDSQRYKQAGNSLVPIIVEAIAKRINEITLS